MSSIFYTYFSKTLNWPLLKSRYLQVIVKGLALYMDKIRHDITYVRDQYFAELAEQQLMNDHAASRGIHRNRFDTDEQYRARIINAYRWQKLAGTVTGLPQIMKESGYPGAHIHNCREEDVERWAEFGIIFDAQKVDISQLVPLVNEYKPARSRLALIKTPVAAGCGYGIVGYAKLADRINSVKGASTCGVAVVGYVKLRDYITSITGD